MINLYLEYLRHLLPLTLFGVPLWLVIKASRIYWRGERSAAGGLVMVALLLTLLTARFAAGAALFAVLAGPPASEATLIAQMQQETGIQLPPMAKVVSYRTGGGFFGYWSGFLRADIDCRQMGQVWQLSGSLFDDQTPLQSLSAPKVVTFDIWRSSRFTIPAGADVAEYNIVPKHVVYAVDSKACAVYYHRIQYD